MLINHEPNPSHLNTRFKHAWLSPTIVKARSFNTRGSALQLMRGKAFSALVLNNGGERHADQLVSP
ncbi:MAG: hypothetical protein ABJZ55_13345 [Fuerstiella sp.]